MTKSDWIEHATIESLKGHHENSDIIRAQVNTLLSVALSGGGAALYLAGSSLSVPVPALVVSLYLFALAGIITWKCTFMVEYPPTWNEPKNLNRPDCELNELQESELLRRQKAIVSVSRINRMKGEAFNLVVKGLCATPVLGLITWLVA